MGNLHAASGQNIISRPKLNLRANLACHHEKVGRADEISELHYRVTLLRKYFALTKGSHRGVGWTFPLF